MESDDSSDGEIPASRRDLSSLTVGPGSPEPKAGTATSASQGRGFPPEPVAGSNAALDPPDQDAFVLKSDRRSAAESFVQSVDPAGPEANWTVPVLPAGIPPADPTVAKLYNEGAPTHRERPLPTIDGYEILAELGRGGMGVVYLAQQILLGRPCVLKMILAGAYANDEAVVRFLAEAEAVACLQHPNIVQIYHIGEVDGLPYFELEFVAGGSLDQRLTGIPWPARKAAELIEGVACGVAEAHRMGIIHRDLKPANILLAGGGVPKITDFGLAKSLAKESGLTRTDSIMGSPGYMAPEQAEGKSKEVGTLADVYAVGAILYDLITGRPPFRGTTILETLEQVKTTEPVPPSRLVPGVPRDLETIALKCLQKEPAKRYESAAALAEDLRRFLGGEPIIGRPVPFWELGWRLCRRHPAPAALTAAIILVGALGLAGILWQWGEAVKARDLASRRAVAEARARHEAETILVDMYTTSGIAAGDQGENAQAALWFANAARRAEADPDRRFASAVRARIWGRQTITPLAAVVADGSWPDGLIFHMGGRYLITKTVTDAKTREASSLLWDLDAERSLPFPGGLESVLAAAWSPDGDSLSIGAASGDVAISRFPGGEETMRVMFPGRVRLLKYSANGRYLAIAGGSAARVWDVQSHAFATPELSHPEVVTALAFHPDGRFVATGCLDNRARLFAVRGDTASPLWPPVPHLWSTDGTIWFPVFVSPPLFVDQGRTLVTYGGKGRITWHTVETGEEIRTVDSSEPTGRVVALELSPDGRYLAVVGFQSPEVRLFDASTGDPVGPVLKHTNTVFGAAFSPDSRMILTGSTDGTARLWAIPGGEALARPLDLHRSVRLVAFAPDGRSFATQDGELVRRWALPEDGVPITRVPIDGARSFAALSPDGALTIPTGMSFANTRLLRSTRAFFVADGRPAGPPLHPGGLIIDASFSPDGRSVATVGARDDRTSNGQEVVTWDWASGRQNWRGDLPSEARSVSYRPDGRRLAVLCGGGQLLVFNSDDGREIRRWSAHDAEAANHWITNGKVVFSPDGRDVVTWGMGNDVRVWDAETGRPRYPFLQHRDKCHDVEFSPDCRSMVLASYDGSVTVRDVATGTVVTELPAHPDIVYSARFSPDGKLLVTACRDRTVRVWDWPAGRLACPPFEHTNEAIAASFTPDGRWVLSIGDDATARAWDWRTGKPITPPLQIRGYPRSLDVTSDGKHAVVGGFQDDLAVLDLRELVKDYGDPEALALWAELVAGQQFHAGGGTVNLAASEWIERWRAFRPLARVADPGTIQVDLKAAVRASDTDREKSAEPHALPREEDVISRFDRADTMLRAGRIEAARSEGRGLVPLFGPLIELSSDDPSLRHRLALALVLAGDHEAYRLACAATVQHFGGYTGELIGEAARACLIGPDGMDDFSVPLRMAETAVSRDPNFAWNYYVLGLAHFRGGRYESSIASLEKSLQLGTTWAAAPLNYPVLAMAHQRLGHRDEARRCLEKARGRRGTPASDDAFKMSAVWWDRVEFRLLLREADALILDAAFPPNPLVP
jgi:WD40 repeat protein/tetratricopeptide (TPR) repeat protein